MRVAYLSQFDPGDTRAWSGADYRLARCLENAGIEVEHLGPLKSLFLPVNIGRYLINHKVLGKQDHPRRDPSLLRSYARQAQRKLARSTADAIFAPGSLPLAYLETRLPVVLCADATFANLVGYYPDFSNLSARALRNGHDAERRALHACSLVLLSSQWAAESAARDYGVDPSRIRVLRFGGSLPGVQTTDEVENLINARLEAAAKELTLYCSGLDWERKGIDFACQVVAQLNAKGTPARLLVSGAAPPQGASLPPYVSILGRIPNDGAEGTARLASLFQAAQFFILPTRADCTPLVFSEAASYALPVVSTATGGIGSVVDDGISGRLFGTAEPAVAWADWITRAIRDPDRYAQLCRSSYMKYQRQLNWNSAGQTIKKLLEELIRSRRRSASD